MAVSGTPTLTQPVRTKTPLTTAQKKGFLAAYAGWTLDGMDAFIYALVLVPALRELLPKSGIEATPGNIGYYGSILFALFLAGWGMSMVWGPIADRFGRVFLRVVYNAVVRPPNVVTVFFDRRLRRKR